MPRSSRHRRKSASRNARKLERHSNRLRGFEPLEQRIALSATPFGAQPHDTAEFMLGTVNVSVVLLESNKVFSSDNPTVGTSREENWTAASIESVKEKVKDGLKWWVDALEEITDKHQLSFNIDFTHADTPVSTRFEPITQPSTDYQFWIYDFLNSRVTTTGSFPTDVRNYNHSQREANNTNWAFTIFVVNDEKDADNKFAPGGLDRAFAFPGGLFLVTLASRPASTITHETGHIFWAMDEYQGGGTYNTTRGYYDTQNVNAWNNPTPNYVREPSIMDRGSCEEGGGLLCDAFLQHTSSTSSLESIGWRDSDGDGIFDLLDVAHTLEGTGTYDPVTGIYHFVGASSVQSLPNLNPRNSSLPTESLQNDITINRISRAEFRIDGGSWEPAATPNTYVAALDLSFDVPATVSQVEIRTIDAVTGVTSPVFVADLRRPASAAQPGISGFVFRDADSDGQFETGEGGLDGLTVRLVDSTGQPITLQKGVEPDDYGPDAVISNVIPGVTLTAIGTASSGGMVYARSVGQGSTGSQAFGACSFTGSGGACSIYQTEWTSRTRQLHISFASPVTTVSIDALSNNAVDYGRLAIYDANNNLLARYTTQALASGQFETMTLSRPTADIAYAIAGGHADTGIRLDNLTFGPETVAVTDAFGAYSIPYLEAGSYRVQAETPADLQATSSTTQPVVITESAPRAIVDFGFATALKSWQNPTNRFDVNNDGFVTPIDALLIINDLNSKGSRPLMAADATPPFIDVNGDGRVSPIDVLQVINSIGAAQSEGEASATGQPSNGVDFVSGMALATGVGFENRQETPAASAVPLTPTTKSTPFGQLSLGVFAAPLAAEGEFVPTMSVDTNLAYRPLRSNNAANPITGVRTSLAFPVADSISKAPESSRQPRVSEHVAIDDLLDAAALESAIDAFAEDLAVVWQAARTRR